MHRDATRAGTVLLALWEEAARYSGSEMRHEGLRREDDHALKG